MKGDSRKRQRQASRCRHTAPHGLDQLRKVAVAWIELTRSRRDADDRTRELVRRVTHRLHERAPHVDREIAVAVVLQALQQPLLLWRTVLRVRHDAFGSPSLYLGSRDHIRTRGTRQ